MGKVSCQLQQSATETNTKQQVSPVTHVVIHKMLLRVHVVSQTDEASSELEVIQSAVVVLVEVIERALHFLYLLLVDSLAISHEDLVFHRVFLSCHS